MFENTVRKAIGPAFVFGVSTKVAGNMSFSNAEVNNQTIIAVAEARRAWLASHSIQLEACTMTSLGHDNHILTIDHLAGHGAAEPPLFAADILRSTKPGHFAGFSAIADCPIVVFVNPIKQTFVAAHIGWRSLNKPVLDTLCEQADLLRAHTVVIGPHRRVHHHKERGPDLHHAHWDSYITQDGQGIKVAFGYRLLRELRIRGHANPIIDPRDTATDETLASHSRALEQNTRQWRMLVITGFRQP